MKNLVFLVSAFFIAHAAQAALFRCADAGGRISYQERPCPDTVKDKKQIGGIEEWVEIEEMRGLDHNSSTRVYFDRGSIKKIGRITKVSMRRARSTDSHLGSETDLQGAFYFDCALGQLFTVTDGSEADDKQVQKLQAQLEIGHLPREGESRSQYRIRQRMESWNWGEAMFGKEIRPLVAKVCKN